MSELKYFQCIKKVHARPMTLGEFYAHKNLAAPENINLDTDGFLVIYAKDTEEHYESWSPAKAFEEGYVEIPEGETH